MPIYKNDLKESNIKAIVTSASKHAPSIIVRYKDNTEQIFENEMVAFFIKKYSGSDKRSQRQIGYELEENLRHEFAFLF